MRIVLSGGGTLGSVAPLLAVAEELRKMDSETEFLWLGTKNGPERKLAEECGIPFKPIASGKLRRYFSLSNFFDLFKIKIGFLQSFFILRRFKPDVFVSAGAFVSVPAAFAAYILKIPILIHQQDAVVGLANKIMSAMAKKITVSLDVSLGDFSGRKTELVGNPVRPFIFSGDKEKVFQKFNLKKDLPVMLVMGGGTGAMAINEMVLKSFPELVKFCQIIHLTGKGKSVKNVAETFRSPQNGSLKASSTTEIGHYHSLEFVTSEIADFYAASDLIISRAGMSSLSEICVLGKPAIIIPIPKSHQEKNAEYFAERGAVKIFKTPCHAEALRAHQGFIELVRDLLFNQQEREKMAEAGREIMPRDAGQRMAEIIQGLSNYQFLHNKEVKHARI